MWAIQARIIFHSIMRFEGTSSGDGGRECTTLLSFSLDFVVLGFNRNNNRWFMLYFHPQCIHKSSHLTHTADIHNHNSIRFTIYIMAPNMDRTTINAAQTANSIRTEWKWRRSTTTTTIIDYRYHKSNQKQNGQQSSSKHLLICLMYLLFYFLKLMTKFEWHLIACKNKNDVIDFI